MEKVDWTLAEWRRSSRCTTPDVGCVEMATIGDFVGLRDAKDRGGPILVFSAAEWRVFLAGLHDGDFDLT